MKKEIQDTKAAEDTATSRGADTEYPEGVRVVKKYGKKQRARKRWTEEEIDNLMRGVREYGAGRWKKIHTAYKFDKHRTVVDIKDKYRNIVKERRSKKEPRLYINIQIEEKQIKETEQISAGWPEEAAHALLKRQKEDQKTDVIYIKEENTGLIHVYKIENNKKVTKDCVLKEMYKT